MIENELKLALTESEYNSLLKLGAKEGKKQINYYFYTDNMSSDLMIRIRHKGDSWQLTAKILVENKGEILNAQEYSANISGALAQALIECGINAQQLDSLLGKNIGKFFANGQALRYVGELQTIRSVLQVFDGLNIELDANNYLGVNDYELECECLDDSKLKDLMSYLKSQGIAIKKSCPKSQRFFEKLASIPQLLNL